MLVQLKMNKEHNPYEPPKSQLETPGSRPDGPEGLGGWLLLPMLGLILTPLACLAAMVQLVTLFEPDTWQSLTASSGDTHHPLWMPLILFEAIYNIGFFVFAIYLLIKTFKKSAKAPQLFILFYAINLLMQFVDTGLFAIIGQTYPDLMDGNTYKDLGRAVVGSLIWIPYFKRSVRVKNTFVN